MEPVGAPRRAARVRVRPAVVQRLLVVGVVVEMLVLAYRLLAI